MPKGVLLSCRPRRYWRVARAAAFGHTIPATSFNSCVLPAPWAPASTQRSPGRMVQLMFFRTVRPPRCRLRRAAHFQISRAGAAHRAHWIIAACREWVILDVTRPARRSSGGAMRLRLLAPRYWLTWAGLGLLRVAALLPFPWMVAVGSTLGAVLRRLPIGFVGTARRNLELCFPELPAQARERLLDRHFESLGIALLEIPLAWWLSPARLARIVHVEGAEHLRAAVARGRGVILLTAHFTPMEMAGPAPARGGPGRVFYLP